MGDTPTFREIDQALHEIRKIVEAIASSVGSIARALEQEDRLREREERAAERERDDQNKRLEKTLNALHERLDALIKDQAKLPADTLAAVEKKIYELRTARWEALQVGAQEPMPLPPAGYRETTGKIAVARDHTGAFDTHHTDGERRTLNEWLGSGVRWLAVQTWTKLIVGAGGGVAIWEAVKHWLLQQHG